MSPGDPLLTIEKNQYVVKLHKDTLEVDFKSGARKALESAVERRPGLRDSVGLLFQAAVPLDVALWNIDKVLAGDDGRVKIVIPHRKDLRIKLEPDEAKRLVEMLNRLIPEEKRKHLEKVRLEKRAMAELDRGSIKARRYVVHR